MYTKAAQATSLARTQTKGPWVVLPNVICTEESYAILIFVTNAASTVSKYITKPGYIGRMTRLEMGSGPAKGVLNNKQRYRKPAVTTAVPAEEFTALAAFMSGKLYSILLGRLLQLQCQGYSNCQYYDNYDSRSRRQR